jgi:hypothetical protein
MKLRIFKGSFTEVLSFGQGSGYGYGDGRGYGYGYGGGWGNGSGNGSGDGFVENNGMEVISET